jgi:glycosyltransferase involved in cell wall biosynthesis
MDGGSSDDTVAILTKYSDRLAFVSERDRGHSHAVNKGFQRAKGEIIAFLNSDDTYLPGAVSAAVEALAANPDSPMVYGEAYHVAEDGSVIERYPSEPFSAERLRETCFICQPTAFMRKDAVAKVGWLNEDLDFCMDYELWIRLSQLGVPTFIQRFMATSRLYPENKTLSNPLRSHWEIARVWKNLSGEVPSAWVFGLAQKIVESRLRLNRSKRVQNAAFVFFLAIVSAFLLLYFNQEIKRNESRQLGDWFRWLFAGGHGRLLTDRRQPGAD